MNTYDRNNLNFILSLDENGFDEWSATLSADDIDYALELLRKARSEVIMKVAECVDSIEDFTEASMLLKKFML